MLSSVDASGWLVVFDVDDVVDDDVDIDDAVDDEVDGADVAGAELDDAGIDGAEVDELGTVGGFAEFAVPGEAPGLLAHATTPNARRSGAIVVNT